MTAVSNQAVYRMVLRLLDRKDRIRFSICLVLILVATGLELLSLGMVIPVVQVVLGGERLETYGWVPDSIEDMRYQTFVFLLLGGLITAFLLKNLFLLASNYYQQRAQLSLGNRITQRLFETYLQQPYEYHLTHSSSVLMSRVSEYSNAVLLFLGPSLVVIGDFLTGLGFLIVLLIVQPVTTLVVGVIFGSSAWAVLRLTRKRAEVWGRKRIDYRIAINNALLSGFGGVKEIKLFGRDQQVINLHKTGIYGTARTVYMFNVIQAVPRAVFEMLAIGSIALTIVIARFRGQTNDEATLTIALFGVVAFRMLPSINRVVTSLQQLALTRPGLEGAVEGFALPLVMDRPRDRETLGPFTELGVFGLRYRYPNTESEVLNLDHLKVMVGESVGIVGSSGSGKSTLVDVLIGILNPTGGTITINGKNLDDVRRKWQDKIGYVPQHVYLMDTTIRKNVAFGLPDKVIDDERVERALQQAHLLDFVNTLPLGWDTETGERGVRMSGGQRQRLGIARALYANPEVIVLDEATSALDSATEREIVESFRELATDRTLIVVAHRTSTLKYCSRLIRIEEGRIVQEGTFEEVVGSLSDDSNRGQ
jgi:ABC-type multidrug transport system fused ATPase/permease subunit